MGRHLMRWDLALGIMLLSSSRVELSPWAKVIPYLHAEGATVVEINLEAALLGASPPDCVSPVAIVENGECPTEG